VCSPTCGPGSPRPTTCRSDHSRLRHCTFGCSNCSTQAVVPANAGTHNPWRVLLSKASATSCKRKSAPYGSPRSRLCENSREQSARRIVFSLFFAQLSASEISFPIKDIRDKVSTRKVERRSFHTAWFAGTTAGCEFAFSRHDAPEFYKFIPPQNKGAGKTGCALHPRSRVQTCTEKTHTSIQVQRRQSGLPCAMVLRLISCSPRRDRACLPPSPPRSVSFSRA
jgi:hypothetical protein